MKDIGSLTDYLKQRLFEDPVEFDKALLALETEEEEEQ